MGLVKTTGLCGAPVPPHGRAGHPCRRASAHGRAGPAHEAGAVLPGSARRPHLESEMLRASLPIRAHPLLALERWCQRLASRLPSRLLGNATARRDPSLQTFVPPSVALRVSTSGPQTGHPPRGGSLLEDLLIRAATRLGCGRDWDGAGFPGGDDPGGARGARGEWRARTALGEREAVLFNDKSAGQGIRKPGPPAEALPVVLPVTLCESLPFLV